MSRISHSGNYKSIWPGIHELQKRLQAVQSSQRRGRRQLRSISTDFENVAFVLAQFLDFFAGMIRMDLQRCLPGTRSLCKGRNSSLTRELLQEPLNGMVQSGFGMARLHHRKRSVDA